MFEQLNNRFARIVKNIRGQGKITDKNISEALRDVRRALLEADVNFDVAKLFINRVKDKAFGHEVFTSVTPGQQFIQIIENEMASFLGDKNEGVHFNSIGKTIILLVGLQGSGKTTTAVKLASFLKNKWNKTSHIIAADLQRPAAVKQLQILAKTINVPVYTEKNENVAGVIKNGLSKIVSEDVIIIDTAGRLHIDNILMAELQKIVDITSPDEILYVADGMMGQDAVNSTNIFNNTLNLTGIILTKMDGDSRGGAALSMREITGKSIKFIGIGERTEDFDLFFPDRLAKRILGMGDIVSLVEKAKEVFDEENASKLHKKMLNNSFTLVDFQYQIEQMQKMGPMNEMINLIPAFAKSGKINLNDHQLSWTDAIIKSMTAEERNSPEIINGSRRKRIATGSGRKIQEVNQLLKQFKQMKIMIKKINKTGVGKFPFKIK